MQRVIVYPPSAVGKVEPNLRFVNRTACSGLRSLAHPLYLAVVAGGPAHVRPLVLLTMAYDWWSSGKVLKVTLFSSVFLFTMLQVSQHIGYTAPWQRLAAWVAPHSPAFH